MGFRLPEKPVLFYPSLARQIGTDEALLYAIYADYLQARGELNADDNPSITLSRQAWLALVDFWTEPRLVNVTRSLANHGYIQAVSGEERITLTLIPQLPDSVYEELPIVEAAPDVIAEPERVAEEVTPVAYSAPLESTQTCQPFSEPAYAPAAEYAQPAEYAQTSDYQHSSPAHVPPVTVQKLPVMEEPPSRADLRPLREQQQVQPQNRGPAPTFGGSIGWSKSRPQPGAGNLFASQLDELEQKNKKLHCIYLGWRPSKILFDTLPRHSIPAEFAEQLIDEFVLYWLDKDRKETNWDQKFLAWVKREWVHKQTRDAREQRFKQGETVSGPAAPVTDSRQKRQRVTAAIMDIKDTDW